MRDPEVNTSPLPQDLDASYLKLNLPGSPLPMNGLTARLSLDLLDLKPGQVIAVTGGPGAYGGYVIQLRLEWITK